MNERLANHFTFEVVQQLILPENLRWELFQSVYGTTPEQARQALKPWLADLGLTRPVRRWVKELGQADLGGPCPETLLAVVAGLLMRQWLRGRSSVPRALDEARVWLAELD